MDIAYDEAASALVDGPKVVETVQAFLILAVYPVPKKKWSDDRSWLFMGAAIRCVDLLAVHQHYAYWRFGHGQAGARAWFG